MHTQPVSAHKVLRVRAVAAGLAVLAMSVAVVAQPTVTVIFSEIPNHPSSIVIGAKDLAGNPVETRFKALEDLTVSPDGTMWLLKGRTIQSDDESAVLLLGEGLTGAMLAQEGQPVLGGEPGEVNDFFDTTAGFNEQNQYAFGARARNGDDSIKEKVIVFDGVDHMVVVQESDPALGLVDLPPNPSGDETFGNSMNSIHLLNNLDVGFVAVTINNIHSSKRPAIFYNNMAFAQSGTTPIDGGVWDSFDSDDFTTTPDGTTWVAQGDDEGPTTTDDILVVNGQVVLREGSQIGDTGVIYTDTFNTDLAANGDWFARGDDPDNNDWAVRSGTLLAKTGDPIISDSDEHWGDTFLSFTGNAAGDWLLIGNTDNADPAVDTVVVLNGEEVILREGDPIDLDGNGQFDDDVFIGRGVNTNSAFAPNDLFLADDLGAECAIFVIAPLRNAAGEDLGSDPPFGAGGEALLCVSLDVGCPCLGDFDDDFSVTFADLVVFLECLETPSDTCGCADFDGDQSPTFADLVLFLDALATGQCG